MEWMGGISGSLGAWVRGGLEGVHDDAGVG